MGFARLFRPSTLVRNWGTLPMTDGLSLGRDRELRRHPILLVVFYFLSLKAYLTG